MDRLKRAAAETRAAAQVQRDHGRDAAADRYELRAADLESGRVTDNTDAASGLISWAFSRR